MILSALSLLLATIPAAAATWSVTPANMLPRSEIQAAFANGKVYVAGGIARFRTTARCEAFDIARKVWTACPDLPVALHHVSLTSMNGRVYAGGGFTNLLFSFFESPTLWRLSTDGQSWETVGRLPYAVGEHALVGMESDLYLVGGSTKAGTSNQLWRLRDGEWAPMPSMATARDSFAVVQRGAELWVIGGRDADGGALGSVEVYDTAKQEWTQRPPLPYQSGGLTAVVVGGEIHAFGGEDLTTATVFNQQFRFDEQAQDWVAENPPPQPRHGAAAISVDGVGYLIGGGRKAGWRTVYSVSGTVQVLAL